MKNIVTYLCIIFSVVWLSNCSSGTTSTVSTSQAITGTVTAGPVSGALVDIYTGDGLTLLANNIMTDNYGNWFANIPANSGIVLAIAKGGQYVDEFTGKTIQSTSMKSLFDTATATATAPITPLTNALTETAQNNAATSSQANLKQALSNAQKVYTAMLGFDPLATLPSNLSQIANASVSQKNYATLLGAFSKLANDAYTALAAGNPTTKPFDLVTALISDFAADGIINGIGAAGTALTIGNGGNLAAALPAAGPTALQNAINLYLASPNAPKSLPPLTVKAPANFIQPVNTPAVTTQPGTSTTPMLALTISGNKHDLTGVWKTCVTNPQNKGDMIQQMTISNMSGTYREDLYPSTNGTCLGTATKSGGFVISYTVPTATTVGTIAANPILPTDPYGWVNGMRQNVNAPIAASGVGSLANISVTIFNATIISATGTFSNIAGLSRQLGYIIDDSVSTLKPTFYRTNNITGTVVIGTIADPLTKQ